MDCPRCEDGSLTAYALGDSRARVCESCGFAEVPADHRRDAAAEESWADAVARFERDERPEPDAVGDPPTVPGGDSEPPTVEDVGTVTVDAALDGGGNNRDQTSAAVDEPAAATRPPTDEGPETGETTASDVDARTATTETDKNGANPDGATDGDDRDESDGTGDAGGADGAPGSGTDGADDGDDGDPGEN